jgi:hypothetical protein
MFEEYQNHCKLKKQHLTCIGFSPQMLVLPSNHGRGLYGPNVRLPISLVVTK